VASAHGNLRDLLKNRALKGLLGGTEQVILGDQAAAKNKNTSSASENGPRKLLSQRAGAPTFEVIVEVQRCRINAWDVTMDAAFAVDEVLAGRKYIAQHRMRSEDGSSLRMKLIHL
jgi:hypothetical protein